MVFDRSCGTGAFSPGLSAGSANPSAGAFSAFLTTLTRSSGEQNISGVKVALPRGVLAKLAGMTLCEGAAAQAGDCPASSQIGTVQTAVGPGPSPLLIPQPGKDPTAVYLTGPYKGAPYGIAVKVPAQAGPFDLGDVVTRASIDIDPETAQATVSSDPLPQYLEGVPVSYRTVHVAIDRPGFTINPTNCRSMDVEAEITSPGGAVARPGTRFQVGNCQSLGFRPKLSMRLIGKTNRGAHPRVRAILNARNGDANLSRAQVTLPRSAFLDQAHIRTVCTRVQFRANACPLGSIYGHARALSPLLDRPLEGPVYLRSSSHKLPDLVLALRGQVDIDAVGRVDSVNGGIRVTFEGVPDAPVTQVVIDMQGGHKGLLVNSRNICAQTDRVTVELDGQNGKTADQEPPLKRSCGRKRATRGSAGSRAG